MEASNKRQKTRSKEIMEEEGEEEDEEKGEEEGEEEETPLPLADDSGPTVDMTCGICFSDVGLSIRGRIDSCNHYFCFICIMEWSKVETRCPLCKLRFRSIRRPPMQGIFTCERVVDVPERNQVYNHYGHGSTSASDPYANTMCNKCQTAENEELLLLCDLCDSASHTYCVGLGETVPEGDWFCCDCAKIKDEHSRTQSDTDGCNQDSYDRLRAVRASEPASSFRNFVDGVRPDSPRGSSSEPDPRQRVDDGYIPQNIQITDEHSRHHTVSDGCDQSTSETPVSIFEIVSDPSQGFSELAVHLQGSDGDIPHFTRRRSQSHVVSTREAAASTGARGDQHVRTLQQCRNVQGHIRHIRENWTAIRSGSLTFSSTLGGSNNRNYNVNGKNRLNSGAFRQTESISSISTNQHEDTGILSKNPNAGSQDVNRAWKMLKIAKSLEGNSKKTVQSHPSNLSGKGNMNISKDARNQKPQPFNRSCYTPPRSVAVGTAVRVVEERHNYPIHGKGKSTSCTEKELFHRGRVPMQHVSDAELSVNKGPGTLNCKGSATALLSVGPHSSSCSTMDFQDGKKSAARLAHKSSIRKSDTMNCSVKDEVLSLVKLNLKLQSRNQRLGSDTFKEVARVATHTILAACGLEHSKSSARTISVPKCKHTGELRKSNIMPNSCRECFYSFVKDVVSSIFSEKTAPRTHV